MLDNSASSKNLRLTMGGERLKKRRAVVVGINLLVAAAHLFFHPGIYTKGDAHRFFFSYFSDVTIPFAFYFLLLQVETPILKRWQAKCAFVFLGCAVAETLQSFGIRALGATFDPRDYLAYALGVLAAAFLDRQVFSRVFAFWNEDVAPPSDATESREPAP